MDDKSKHYMDKLKSALEKEVLPEGEENELWDRINRENQTYNKKKKQRTLWVVTTGIAASIALLFSFWYQHEAQLPDSTDYMAILEQTSSDVLNSGNIQLVLSDEQKLLLDGKEAALDYQNQGEISVNEEKVGLQKSDSREAALNQLIVPIGKRSSLTLSDGSRMWVNSDSRVIYPVQFEENKREIFVDGEVYLDVKPNEKAPFIVKTKSLDITVLGTKFNVSTSNDQLPAEVVLVSGKVEVKTPHKEKNILSPNQLFSYHHDTKTSQIQEVNVADYVAWKDGYYQFRQQPLGVVLRKIAKYYGVAIEWEEAVGKLSCSGKLDLKDDPEEVYAILRKAAPVEIVNENESIHIKVKQ